jgi:hypothetical protein
MERTIIEVPVLGDIKELAEYVALYRYNARGIDLGPEAKQRFDELKIKYEGELNDEKDND